jgi:hypothetical protein
VNLKIGMAMVLIAAASLAAHAQPAVGEPAPAPASAPKVLPESAPIEDVIEAFDQGFRFDAYIVRWHGARVLVSDPVGACHLGVGDSIHFIAGHGDVGDRHLLTFISTERPEKTEGAAATAPMAINSQTGTALIEQVLSASDGSYRFTAYIAQWQGKRVAIPDIDEAALSVGAEPRIIAMHGSIMGHQVLQFMKLPVAADAGAAKSPVARSVSHEVAVIEEVLRGTPGGDPYAAYIVLWHGAHVAFEPDSPGSLQQPGETALLRIARTDMPIGPGKGLIIFAPDTQESASSADGDLNASATTTQGVVERALAAQVDGYRYRAYVVKWQGSHVVVQDMFATTEYKAGEPISFLMARTTYRGQRRVTFALVSPKLPLAEKGSAGASAR